MRIFRYIIGLFRSKDNSRSKNFRHYLDGERSNDATAEYHNPWLGIKRN